MPALLLPYRMLPDFVLLCVSAVGQGLGRVSREHLAVAVALGVPVAVVVTKVCGGCTHTLCTRHTFFAPAP